MWAAMDVVAALCKDSVVRLLDIFTERCDEDGPAAVQPGQGGAGAKCGCGMVPPHHFTLEDFGTKVRYPPAACLLHIPAHSRGCPASAFR